MNIRAGGDFYFDPSEQSCDKKHILLLAGGVGINPLFSILQEFNYHHSLKENLKDTNSQPRLTFMYSAKTMDELIFMVRQY